MIMLKKDFPVFILLWLTYYYDQSILIKKEDRFRSSS